MKEQRFSRFVVVLTLLAFLITGAGCGHVMNAIEHSDLQTKVKMTDTIFLDPVKLAKSKTIFLSMRNTSELQEIDLKPLLAQKLQQKGYTVTDNPDNADYMLLTNVLYMDYYRETGTKEGGVTGAIAGATAGGLGGRSAALAIIGGMVGGVGGALLGKAIKVETYGGVVDIEIREKTDKLVKGQLKTSAAQGTATTLETTQAVETNYQTYRTKVAATAQKTNLDKNEAVIAVTEKITTQIAGIFAK